MKITYDPDGDVLYIELRNVIPEDNEDVEEGVSLDLDGEGHIIGLEILDASKRMTPEELTNISYENLMLTAEPEEAPPPRRRRRARAAASG